MGYEWALQLSKLGFSIALHGRSQEKLESTKEAIFKSLPEHLQGKVEVKTLRADAGALPTPDLGEINAFLEEPTLDLRVVINNIGITNEEYPLFETLSDESVLSMIHLNISFSTLLSKKCLPLLKKSPGPTLLVNVSSLGAWAPSPYLSVYSGSKAYNLQFSRALYNEMIMEGQAVDVVAMVPGTVISGMNQGDPTSFVSRTREVQSAERQPCLTFLCVS